MLLRNIHFSKVSQVYCNLQFQEKTALILDDDYDDVRILDDDYDDVGILCDNQTLNYQNEMAEELDSVNFRSLRIQRKKSKKSL